MLVYKVVRNNNGILKSYALNNIYCVFYKKNKKTNPHPNLKGSKLFAFNTLDNAVNFINENTYFKNDVEIWECEAEGCGYPKYMSAITNIFNYWLNKNKHKKNYSSNPSFKGTVTCSSITLKKKIYDSQSLPKC